MTTMENYDWIEKGCRVVVVTEGAHGSKVRPDTVTNVTDRHVVTEQSGKFLRRGMRPVGHGEYNPAVVRVLQPDDPYVATVRARIRVRNIGTQITKTTSQFNGDVADALAALDQIEQAVREARATIHRVAAEGK